jgi:hypothetical protein
VWTLDVVKQRFIDLTKGVFWDIQKAD